MKQVLLVEDNVDVAEGVKQSFSSKDFLVEHVIDGKQGLLQASAGSFALIILDLALPGMGGIETCQEIRKRGVETPIIILSAKKDELSKVLALESGADDYLCKPFSSNELQARVKSVLRRSSARQEAQSADCFDLEELSIDFRAKLVSLSGETVALTPSEYDVLELLAQRPFQPISRAEFLEVLTGVAEGDCEANISTVVFRLRQKIEPDPSAPKFVITVRGFGYALGNPSDGDRI